MQKDGRFIPVFAGRASEPACRQAGAAAIREGQASEMSADQALGARIKDTLGKEPLLRDAKNLSVMARKGEDSLSGSIENSAQAEHAVQVARGVEGVQWVEDKLVRESKLMSLRLPINRPSSMWSSPQ